VLVRETLEYNSIACELLVISDGEGAIDYMQSVDDRLLPCPNLVILDLNLPRRSGWEVLERMRRSVACAAMPIIVLTSSDNEKDKIQSSKLGASLYIRKPVRLAEFVEIGSIFKDLLQGRAN